ncbi:DeoR/GlpR family DNA-binding transcription regulator [Aquibacillus rhizosphaerae]|uniref:DeoR/GlpR family DNA-binding transcription regulator n=1 Tax=Aquibacillus rhizosphaerae TaxID=3051431 RepID=A0ABT7L0A2_9BACI|nr:DeoR/GlpR family DNA-binding transcription regulator [Aquibacillus sp. LR5S19]MDL4839247.1 DeoR/GlpR family DNA-binding transcription regulator [Aquibacillus sp. LR5S19]
MLAEKRHKIILEKLVKEKSVKVANLMDEFGVSDETVRRDLELLESKKQLKRVHGGAVIERQDENKEEKSFITREFLHVEEKKEVALKAIEYVQEGQSIAMDVSTTNTEFARELKKHFKQLTVLTNSLPIAYELSEMPHFTIILAGGILRNEELCVIGEMTEDFISQFHIDTLFLSASGVSLQSGITDYGVHEWHVKKKMLKSCKKCFVLADSSKFDAVSLLKVCSINEVTGIITDSQLPDSTKQKFISEGITLIN